MQLPNCWVSIAVICIEYVLCVTSGKLYTLYKVSHTWHEVYEVCRSQGQQMLTFKTAEELCVFESVVKKWRSDDYLKRGRENKEPRDIWIGFCDLDMDSHNAALLKRTHCTDPGQFIKDTTHGKIKLGIENCVLYTHNHKLKKEKCSKEYATVCEKETDECASIDSSPVIGYYGKYCEKVEALSPCVPKINSTFWMCSDTVTNGSTSVLSCSTGTTKAPATAPTAAESTTESDVTTSESDVTTSESDVITAESDVTTSESDVTTMETESASTSEKITSAASTTTPKATAKTPAASASTPKSDVTTSESDMATFKTESAQTPDATTSSDGKTTPMMQLPENLCPNCTTTNNACVWLSSVGPSVDEIKELIKKLTLEKKTLSSYKRAKTSACDDRPTAQAIGKVGIVFFVLAFAGVVLLDCGRVVDCLRKRNRKRVIFSKA